MGHPENEPVVEAAAHMFATLGYPTQDLVTSRRWSLPTVRRCPLAAAGAGLAADLRALCPVAATMVRYDPSERELPPPPA